MSSPDPSQTPPGLLARLAERSTSARAGQTALGGVLVALVAAASAYLLAPGTLAERLPGDDSLGTVALGTYSADRDHQILDEEATGEQRKAAVAAERPVFDWDEAAAEEAAQRVRAAFVFVRSAVPEPRPLTPREVRRHEPPPDPQRLYAPERGAFEARLGLAVADDDFAALAEGHFSEALEGDLVTLVSHGLSGNLVQDPRDLAPARERGLLVRAVRQGVPQSEHLLTDLALVREVGSARADVERAAEALQGESAALRVALGHLAAGLVRPTLVFDPAETARRQQEAAERVKPVVIEVKRGDKIISEGEVIEKRHLVVFRGIRAETRPRQVLLARLGSIALVSSLLLLLWRYARRNVPGFRPSRRDAVLLACATLASAGLAGGGMAVGDLLRDRFPQVPSEAFFFLVPFAAGALVVRSVLSAEVALLFAVASGALVGLVAANSVLIGLYATLTSVLAAGIVPGTRDRPALFRVGAAVGALGAVLVLAMHLFTGRGPAGALAPALASLLAGLILLPVLTMATLPLVHWTFGYLTDLKLLALANLNHPALKDLIIQAPGTYHHSVIVGSLVEGAARAIGANPLLARVCAYYHDLGKIRNPAYFSENQRGENRHGELAPSMSALIVKRHVTDGVEVARRFGLPREVVDVIRQHHGTRYVSFFWAKAKARASADGEGGLAPDETVFRYPGPRPRSREAALIMMADACEASARALPEPTTEGLRALVHKRINEIFSEGQLEECALTLKDLNTVALALLAGLEEVYRVREQGEEETGRGEVEGEVSLALVTPERLRL
ncbi:MAG TPA: HDIG domain-containing protein [Anaeromyxobacteraceae bacterium]|nr:HDIG domain-containing protein [Anaeromyxobacteraceae bacterium]